MSPSSGDANKMTNDIKKYNLGGDCSIWRRF